MSNVLKRDLTREEQEDLMGSFWTMLKELESHTDSNDVLLKRWVEGWHGQWNRLTGDNTQPRWKKD